MQASRLPEAADCLRQTLKRQIELHSSAGVELDRVDLARNCAATLSQHDLKSFLLDYPRYFRMLSSNSHSTQSVLFFNVYILLFNVTVVGVFVV